MPNNADEPIRYLHRRLGYTSRLDQSLHYGREPEAVSESEQERQTREADRRWREELQREWGVARGSILDGVEKFKRTGRLNRRLVSDVRVLERQVGRIDKDVGLR